MKFQHTMLRLNFKDPQVVIKNLNELGEKRWELVAIWPDMGLGHVAATEGIGIFKLRIPD